MVAHCVTTGSESVRVRTGSGEGEGGGAHLDADAVLEARLCGINRDLVVRLVAVLEAEVVVLEVDIEEGEDEVLLDLVPAARGRGEPGERCRGKDGWPGPERERERGRT